jgi:hypothetical protein
MMHAQDYLLIPKSNALDIVTRSSNEELVRRRARLDELGFSRLSRVETSVIPKLEMASTLWPEMAGAELRLWKKFLPTERKFADFAYSSVPDDALDAIELADSAHCFDRIIIWTPEANRLGGRLARKLDKAADKIQEILQSVDPMAVGVIKDANNVEHYFSIVRWGESLWSVKKISRYVATVDWQVRILALILPALILIVGAAFYAAGVMAFGAAVMLGWTGAVIVGIVALAGILIVVAACVMDE